MDNKIIAGKDFFLFATVCAPSDMNARTFSYVCCQPCLTCCHLPESAPYLAESVAAEGKISCTISLMHTCTAVLGLHKAK